MFIVSALKSKLALPSTIHHIHEFSVKILQSVSLCLIIAADTSAHGPGIGLRSGLSERDSVISGKTSVMHKSVVDDSVDVDDAADAVVTYTLLTCKTVANS